MLPKVHIILGVLFSVLVWQLFQTTLLQAIIIFLASFLIDVDHYLDYAYHKRDISLKNSYFWNKNLPIDHKALLHIFHTIEFFILIAILSIFYKFFVLILLGFLFHSIFDLSEILRAKGRGREHFLLNYFFQRKSGKYLHHPKS